MTSVRSLDSDHGSVAGAKRRLPGFVVTAISLATFGPYLVGSIRTEQAVVYGLFVLMLPVVLAKFRGTGGVRFFAPWIGYVIVATLGVLAPSSMPAPYDAGDLLGGYDNILLPLALMLMIWSVVSDEDAEPLLIRACKIIAVAMTVNGLIALLATVLDLTSVLRPFWANENVVTTTSDLAAQMGRFSGIFNQPAEAGALYGIAGIAAIYAWNRRPLLLALLVTVITLGGLISVSKIFLFGGFPAIAIYWLWSQRGHRKLSGLLVLALIAGGLIQSGLLDEWTGADFLGRLFATTDQGFFSLYSAGRFEEDSTFVTVVDQALAYNPISGVGAAGWRTPYDGAVAETLVVGGILGLLLYGFVVAMMFTLPGKLSGSARWFAFLLAALTVGGSLGFSPLTANRVSTVTWLLISLLVLVARSRSQSGGMLGEKRGAKAR